MTRVRNENYVRQGTGTVGPRGRAPGRELAGREASARQTVKVLPGRPRALVAGSSGRTSAEIVTSATTALICAVGAAAGIVVCLIAEAVR